MAMQIQLVLNGSCEYLASVAPAQPAAACFLSCLGPPLLQAQLLRELEHRVTQDAVTRQQLDIIKTSGMETLLKDVEQKEQKLQLLTEEAERASKRGQLQQKKMDRDLKQVRAAGPHPNGLPPWNVCFLGLSAPLAAFSLLCRFPDKVLCVPPWSNCLGKTVAGSESWCPGDMFTSELGSSREL